MGSWALGLQLPSRKATTAFAPCVRVLQIPNLEGEGIIQNGLETQLDVRHFLKRPSPLSACWADWDLGREEKSMSLFLSFLFRHPNLQLLNGAFSVTGPLCVLQDWCSWHCHPGGLEDMWLEAHRAPNLPTVQEPAVTYEGRTLTDDMRAGMGCCPEISWGSTQWKVLFWC